jgi:hypothetical protein
LGAFVPVIRARAAVTWVLASRSRVGIPENTVGRVECKDAWSEPWTVVNPSIHHLASGSIGHYSLWLR